MKGQLNTAQTKDAQDFSNPKDIPGLVNVDMCSGVVPCGVFCNFLNMYNVCT